VAAVLFLVPRTMRFGAIGLLLTFFIALTVHALEGELNADLLLYAVGCIFVLVHGPVSWRAVLGLGDGPRTV
jgi:hypothetical protein